MGRSRGKSGASASFCEEFTKFLADTANQTLLREAICGDLLLELKSLKEVIQKRDEEIETLKKQVAALNNRNDDLEQYTRRNSMRITGIVEEDDEDCAQKVLDVANNTLGLSPPLSLTDIDRAHRTGRIRMTSGQVQPRPLLVKMATYRQRYRIMEQRQKLKGTGIFLNEDLTKTRDTLLYTARKAKNEGKLKDTWSSDGRIFIRKLSTGDGTTGRRIIIKSVNELEECLP